MFLTSVPWITTVPSSSFSAVCQKQAQCVGARGERGLCITSHTHTHFFSPSPLLSWNSTSSSLLTAIQLTSILLTAVQIRWLPSSRLHPNIPCPPWLLPQCCVPQSSPQASPIQRLVGTEQVWIGTLCEQEPVRCWSLSQLPLKNSRREPGEWEAENNMPKGVVIGTSTCLPASFKPASFCHSLSYPCYLSPKLLDSLTLSAQPPQLMSLLFSPHVVFYLALKLHLSLILQRKLELLELATTGMIQACRLDLNLCLTFCAFKLTSQCQA